MDCAPQQALSSKTIPMAQGFYGAVHKKSSPIDPAWRDAVTRAGGPAGTPPSHVAGSAHNPFRYFH
jgi:hypothetical protein